MTAPTAQIERGARAARGARSARTADDVLRRSGGSTSDALPGGCMVAGFGSGIVFIAALAGMIGSFLLENRQERAVGEEQ